MGRLLTFFLSSSGLLAADVLLQHQPIERELSPNETHDFVIPAQTNGFFEIELQSKGSRLAIAVPPGIRFEFSGATMRPVRFCWLEEEPRSSIVSVRSLEKSAVRQYSIESITRPKRPEDAQRARGCELQVQASGIRDLDQKVATLEAALEAFQSASDWRGQAEVLTPLGDALSELGKNSEAVNAYERAVAAWGYTGDAGRKAAAMVPLGTSYGLQSGKAALAASTLRNAIALAQSSGDRLAEAAARNALAGQIAQIGEGPGQPMVREAIAMFHEQGDRWGEGGAWNNLGFLDLNAGSLTEAESAFKRSLDLRRELADEVGVAQCLNNLSVVYSQLGEPGEAASTLEQALEIRKRVATPRAIANTEHNLGVNYVTQGDTDRGIALFEQALAVWRSTGYKFGEALTLTEVATAYSRLGEQDRAARLYRDALAIDRSLENRRAEADVLHDLGKILRDKRLYSQAMEMEQQALKIARQGNFRMMEERALEVLGSLDSDMGHSDKALAELKAAVEVARAGPRQDLSGLETSLGTALLRAGDPTAALAAYQDALKTAQELGSLGDQASSSAGITRAYLAIGDEVSARREALAGIRLMEGLRARIPNPGSRAEFLSRRHDVYQAAVEALMRCGEIAAAFDASEQGRGRSLSDLLANENRISTSNTDLPERTEERNLRVAIAAKSDRLARLLLRQAKPAETDPVRRELTELLDQYSALEERIARTNPGIARAVRAASVSQVQAALSPGEALVEFSLGEDRSYAWLVSRDSIDGVELPRRSLIESEAARLRASLSAPGPSTELSGAIASLSEELFPAQGAASPAALRKFQKLYVVPDGELHFTPFAALPRLQPLELVVLPSATVLTLLPPARHFNGSVAVVADPVYELSDARFSKHGATSSAVTRSLDDEIRFPRLRFSGEEAAAIARLAAPGATLNLTGFGASRQSLLAANLDPYSILHFATHAITYPSQPELSAIVLSLYDQRGIPTDGFLHMYDVAGMRLKSQLVVLSACDTALGRKLEGEGPLGISRTFLSAGASGVVATLWAVDDAATAQFMTAFYRGVLKEKLTPAAALRSAQFFVRSQPRWANPYYWAGFIYTGA